MQLTHFIAPTSYRVERVSSRSMSRRNRRDAELRIASISRQLDDVEARLKALDREWDMERAIELNAGIAVCAMVAIAGFNRNLFFLPAVVGGFLILHAVEGWCPPVPILRRFGFRTMREISQERYALKGLRGDFKKLGRPENIQESLEAARKAMAAADYGPRSDEAPGGNGRH